MTTPNFNTPQTITAAQREAALRAAIQAVLNEHGAELEISDDGKPYGLHSPVLRFTFDTVWDDTNDTILKEYTEFKW